ncbi:MAG TPA: tyrosine-type recombinase/integrase [Nevskiaceae bacterium]|nr:tyrosine-type recombinase/integrase [Nevskiaceae bacterium]
MSKKQQRTPGLFLRGGYWHIDKVVLGRRLCETTGETDRAKAEMYLARRWTEVREAIIHGERPVRTFADAAKRFIEEGIRGGKRAVERDLQDVELLNEYIGHLPLDRVHEEALEDFIEDRKSGKRATGTINRALAVVRAILKLAATVWRDPDTGLTWLQAPATIRALDDSRKRKPYPLDWPEEALFGSLLPSHLRKMFRYATNAGCREQEICKLRWEWEIEIAKDVSVFVLPAEITKNGEERVVVLNRFARKAVDRERGKHPVFVFTMRKEIREHKRGPIIGYEHVPVTKMLNSAWKRARRDAAEAYERRIGRPCPDGFRRLRVQDARHTFGHRLRANDVSLEDRQDLLGHKSGRITTHYSVAEVMRLIAAAESICKLGSRKSPAMPVLRIRDLAAKRRKPMGEKDLGNAVIGDCLVTAP